MEMKMMTKTLAAVVVAVLLGSTAAATVAQARSDTPYSNTWADSSPLGYSTTARHDPRDTNGG
jgi:outer membrane biogenesis lipoprotein LolB